jgi:hypothetical protein
MSRLVILPVAALLAGLLGGCSTFAVNWYFVPLPETTLQRGQTGQDAAEEIRFAVLNTSREVQHITSIQLNPVAGAGRPALEWRSEPPWRLRPGELVVIPLSGFSSDPVAKCSIPIEALIHVQDRPGGWFLSSPERIELPAELPRALPDPWANACRSRAPAEAVR